MRKKERKYHRATYKASNVLVEKHQPAALRLAALCFALAALTTTPPKRLFLPSSFLNNRVFQVEYSYNYGTYSIWNPFFVCSWMLQMPP